MPETPELEYSTPVVELMRLKHDVHNANHDRRCRHGYRSEEVLKKGRSFKLYRQTVQVKGHPETVTDSCYEIQFGHDKVPSTIYSFQREKREPNPFFDALLAASEPNPDVRSLFAKNSMEWMKADDFARIVLKMGLMSSQQIEEVIKTYIDEGDKG